jgi:hypothetical protein
VLPELSADPALSGALKAKLFSLWQVLAPHLPDAVRDLRELTRDAEDAGGFADRIAAVMAGDPEMGQRLLAERDPCERLQVLAERLQGLADSLRPPARSNLDLN